MSLTHIAGVEVEIMGRWMRQRCAWCGVILLHEDYTRLMMPGEWKKPRYFPVTKLVRVEDGNPTVYRMLDDDRLPDDACATLWAENEQRND